MLSSATPICCRSSALSCSAAAPRFSCRRCSLQGGHRLHRVRAANGVGTRLGQPEVLHLAFGDQLLDRAGHVLDRHIRVHAVLVEQVDAVGAQPLQAGLGSHADTLGAAVQPGVGVAVLEPELGGDHHLVTVRRQRLAQQFLIAEGAVHLGRVEEGHALRHGGVQQGRGGTGVGGWAVAEAQAHAPQAQRGNAQAAVAQFSCLHGDAPAGGNGIGGGCPY